MNLLLNLIQALMARLHREEGQTVVEYGLVIGGVSLVLIAAFIAAGLDTAITDLVGDIKTAMGV